MDGMLQRLGIDCIDLLQLSDPHRYVPRQDLGEDTYCWGVRLGCSLPNKRFDTLGSLSFNKSSSL